MYRKIVAIFVVLALLLSLVACSSGSTGSNAGSTNGNETTEETKQTEEKETKDESVVEKPTEKIKLSGPQLGYNDDQIATAQAKEGGLTPFDEYYIAVRKTIEEEYPNYEVEYLDWGWAETLDQKQRAALSAGDPPSVVAGETFMPTYANSGILEPLPQDIVDSVNPSFLVKDFNGVPMAVAHKSSIFMLFYNKKLLADAGLDPNAEIKTWEDWRNAAQKVTEMGGGKVWGGGIPTFPHFGGSLRATPFFRQMGTDFGAGDNINLTDPKVIETLQYIRDMNAFLPPGLGNAADEGPLWEAFEKNQTIAFVVNGSWQASAAERNNMDWGVAPLPLPEGGQVGNCMVGSVYLGVPKDAKNKEHAFNLIRAQLKKENLEIWLKETTCVPLKSIIEDESLYADNPTLLVAMRALREGSFSGLTSFSKNDAQIWEIINTQVLARTTMTNDPIEKICEDAQKQIENLLK